MTTIEREDADLSAIREDLLALKSDMGRILRHFKADVLDGAQGATDRIGGGLCNAGAGAADQSLRSAKAVGAWVERQPMLAFLIAVSVGYFGARALSR
jgi:hypothetical protein